MRKNYAWLLVSLWVIGLLTGCTALPEPTAPSAATQAQTEATAEETGPQEVALGDEDTYWRAYQWESDDGLGAEGPQTLREAEWYLDLFVSVDGTARFRDIHEGVCLTDDSYLKLMWERSTEGDFLFYNALQPAPILRGVCEGNGLILDYLGTTLYMRREAIPEKPGQWYAPAELVGTWLLVSGEIEGYSWEAMPNELSGLVISVTSLEGPLVLSADILEWGPQGEARYESYGQILEVLQQPLYEGCENGAWSVRIGQPSPRDANGYPTETEFYATLVGENELHLQRHYTMDGYPAVSHQTYLRLTDLVSWMEYESMDLDHSNWVCTGYNDPAGEELALPAELEDFSVILSPDQTCLVHYNGQELTGIWQLGEGGILLLRSEENAPQEFWFGGVISGCWVDTPTESLQTYQMALYANNGILKLSLQSRG